MTSNWRQNEVFNVFNDRVSFQQFHIFNLISFLKTSNYLFVPQIASKLFHVSKTITFLYWTVYDVKLTSKLRFYQFLQNCIMSDILNTFNDVFKFDVKTTFYDFLKSLSLSSRIKLVQYPEIFHLNFSFSNWWSQAARQCYY